MKDLTEDLIAELAAKKLAGTITPEESELLEAWVTRDAPNEIHWDNGDRDETALRDRLLESIRRDAGLAREPARVRSLGFLRIAAAILLLIGGTVFFKYANRKMGGEGGGLLRPVAVEDLPPGHSGAVLTLGNGRKIVLDSMSNGSVAVQGSLKVVKANGSLMYDKQLADESRSSGNLTNTVTTPRGREFEIILSDGTRVWLNAASSITYPLAFGGDERRVSVTGEAYFEVAADKLHPFIVSVGDAKIAVLGTHFDIMAYPDEKSFKTTLIEGSVKVSNTSGQVIMAPGEQAVFSPNSDGIDIKKVDASQSIAWVDGKLSLDNLGIRAIMREVSRWYDVNVSFEGPVPEERFWGLINRNVNLSSVLHVMNANGINARLQDGEIVISSK